MLVGCVGRQGWSEEVKKSGILMCLRSSVVIAFVKVWLSIGVV